MSESRRLRAGVVGVGHLGSLHAAKYAELDGVDLVSVYDADAQTTVRVARASGCAAAGSLEVLLRDCDVVSVAVPASAHVEVGTHAARAGVHMLVEKPLAADAASARVLASEAESAGVVLQVGHLERFNPVMEEVHRLIGTPRFVECHRLSPFAGRGTDANVVVDVMIHDLDLLAVRVDRPIVEVQAVGVPVLSGTVDIANARIRFEGGCIANVTASRVSLKRERKMRIFQEDAYVSLDLECRSALIARRRDPASSPASHRAVDSPIDSPIGSPMDAIEVETREFADADPLAAEIDSFVSAVREGRPPAVGAREALDALEMAGRILECIEVPGAEVS